jgi:hypothetical protein
VDRGDQFFVKSEMMKFVIFLVLLVCSFELGGKFANKKKTPFVNSESPLIPIPESISCDGEAKNTEIRLRRKLFCNYDKSVRPVNNYRNKTMVKMKMIVKTFKFVSRRS